MRNIDLKTLPVDKYCERLKSSNPEKRDAAISSLGALIAGGNKEAFDVLCGYFSDFEWVEGEGDFGYEWGGVGAWVWGTAVSR